MNRNRLVRCRTRERGVTLVEMVIVIAIVGLMAGITLPSVTAGLDSVRLASASQTVASFLNSADNRAERLQQPVEIEISTGENCMRLLAGDGYSRELAMPEGVRILSVTPGGEEGSTFRAILLPGGTVPGIGIELGNAHGSRRLVKLDPMTGYPRVERVK
jgi:prepilin-type N-terminal cleavage/methylation domain-containing protein